MNKTNTSFLSYLGNSTLNSYTQIFFSNNKWLGAILILVSFFDSIAGLSGLIAVITANGIAYFFGINKQSARLGLYGFNALLVGLGIGISFEMNLNLLLITLFAAMFTFFITVSMEGVLGKYGLPYLSIPFLLGLWVVLLASRQYANLEISQRGIYASNEMMQLGGNSLLELYYWFNNLDLPLSLKIYFRSLGAIFFQYHLFAGLLIAVGLILASRISFLLSLIGFYAAYSFYQITGANISELSYSYIGFNYILTSIALGGFFIIASPYSLLWVVLLTPLTALILTSTSSLLAPFQLSVYSLPFNIVVILFLYVLKFRVRHWDRPALVGIQHYSPEDNLYSQNNYTERFKSQAHFPIGLPFMGKWKITQAFNGKYTHKEEWKYAWDFEISDENGELFSGNGKYPKDYYCFNKPVIAPADGKVEKILDGIEDNEIGGVNLEHNWGNSIVIKHAEQLFSQISHIKKGSFKVKRGDMVKKGDVLGYCGNSGRSPQPHIHFQIQKTPQIGSKTMKYPLVNYLVWNHEKWDLQNSAYPEHGSQVTNIQSSDLLVKAFNFIPGHHLQFAYDWKDEFRVDTWLVEVNMLNQAYLLDEETGAKAYFMREGNVFAFTRYEGKKEGLLFYFYLVLQRVVLGHYSELVIQDSIPLKYFMHRRMKWLQDWIAPVFTYLSIPYSLKLKSYTDDFLESHAEFEGQVLFMNGNKKVEKIDFQVRVNEKGISDLEIRSKEHDIKATLKEE